MHIGILNFHETKKNMNLNLNRYISLRIKIILLICGMTILVSLLIGGFGYYSTVRLTFNNAIEGLAGETRLMALRFKNAFQETQNDAFIILQTPPIEGIIRTRKKNIDTKDLASTNELWRKRLEQIFISIMDARPQYTQMRYIGVANNGLELVRVNRTHQGLQAVPMSQLQEKAGEPYFKKGLELKQGQVYFSNVSFNREYGKVESSNTPTIRTVIPVYHNRTLFGMIVINTNYYVWLKKTFNDINPTNDTFVTYRHDDIAEFDPKSKQLKLNLADPAKNESSSIIDKIAHSQKNELLYQQAGNVYYLVRMYISENNPEAYFGIIVRTTKNALLSEAYHIQHNIIFLWIAAILLCILIAALSANKLSAQLKVMTEKIRDTEQHPGKTLALPIQLNDEIGELARAFKRLTHKLQQSEAKVRAVLDNIVDGIITFEADGRIDSINPACQILFGYRAEEIVGKNLSMLLPEPDYHELEKNIRHYLSTGSSTKITTMRELEGQHKNGTRFPIEVSLSEVKSVNRLLFTGIIRDITERKKMDIMKDEFISTVSHELRTPLTSIQGALGILRAKSRDKLDTQDKKILDLSYDNCLRLTDLVNDILDIEKIAAGKMDYQIEKTEIISLVKRILEQNKSYADQYRVHFTLKTDMQEIYCHVDGSKFEQALVNIISNAAKFSDENSSVIISVFINESGKLIIAIADKGPGIPDNFREKIFDRFAQVDSSSTRAKGGTGLGLSITKSIIEAFGGEVTFDSEMGKGTTFYFILPLDAKEVLS